MRSGLVAELELLVRMDREKQIDATHWNQYATRLRERLEEGGRAIEMLELAVEILDKMGHSCPSDVGLKEFSHPCGNKCQPCWRYALCQRVEAGGK